MDRLPSLDLLLNEVRAAREAQIRHFDGLDSKAGIVMGFSGALVALLGREPSFPSVVGRGFAVVAALLSLWAFAPRDYPVLELLELRLRYVRAEAEFTKLHLLDTQIEMARQASRLLERKARRLKLAVGRLSQPSLSSLPLCWHSNRRYLSGEGRQARTEEAYRSW